MIAIRRSSYESGGEKGFGVKNIRWNFGKRESTSSLCNPRRCRRCVTVDRSTCLLFIDNFIS